MTQDLIDRSRRRHTLTDTALLVLIIALAIALIVAAVVVSIGVARAGTLGAIAGNRLAFALCGTLIVAGAGSLAAALMRSGEIAQRQD
jgi:hypothetical protein